MNYTWLWVFVGGGLGAVLRSFISARSSVGVGIFAGIPLGTLWVNWVGSFLLGMLIGMLPEEGQLKAGLTTGLMGGLTTFSTFTYEGVSLFKGGLPLSAAVHMALHCVGGILLATLGLSIGLLFCRQSVNHV